MSMMMDFHVHWKEGESLWDGSENQHFPRKIINYKQLFFFLKKWLLLTLCFKSNASNFFSMLSADLHTLALFLQSHCHLLGLSLLLLHVYL